MRSTKVHLISSLRHNALSLKCSPERVGLRPKLKAVMRAVCGSLLSSLTLVCFVVCAQAEDLASINTGELTLRLSTASGGYELLVTRKGGTTELNPTVFTLDGPPRLVVDIPNVTSKNSQKKDLQDPSLTSVRVGAHKDKTRFVVDISTGELPTYEVRESSSSRSRIVFRFGESPTIDRVNPETPSERELGSPQEDIDKAIEGQNSEVKPSDSKSGKKETAEPTEDRDALGIITLEKDKKSKETPAKGKEVPKETPTDSDSEKVISPKDDYAGEATREPAKESPKAKKEETKKELEKKEKEAAKQREIITVIGNDRISDADADLDKESDVPDAEEEDITTTPPKLTENPSEKLAKSEPEKAPEKTPEKKPEKITPEPKEETPKASTKETEDSDTGSKKVETDDKDTHPSPKKDVAKVQGLFFKTVNTSGEFAVAISGDNLDEFKLAKKRSNVWELVIQNAKLGGPYLSLPQFPPDSFHGFESVAAVQRDEDVIVRIFVEDDAKLTPFRSGKEVWVKITEE